MTFPTREAGSAAEHVAQLARLPLPDARRATAAALLAHFYTVVDDLDGLDLGEDPRGITFDPRWV